MLTPSSQSPERRKRRLAVETAVVFCISSGFPVVAGLSKNTSAFPKWWGLVDVGLAFVLTIMAFAILGLVGDTVDKRAEGATYRVYRSLIHVLLAMTVVYMISGDRIVWVNCATGFGWRAWLLLYMMPAWITALGTGTALNESGETAMHDQG